MGPETGNELDPKSRATRTKESTEREWGAAAGIEWLARYSIEYARPEEGESCDEMRSMAEIRYKIHGEYYKKINYKPNEAIDDDLH